MRYAFTNTWFNENSLANWNKIIPVIDPSKILDVGSHEGAASCFLIDLLAQKKEIEIHCVDIWSEFETVKQNEAQLIESRFDYNINIAIKKAKNKVNFFKHKNKSHFVLSQMVSKGIEDFDLIYIDASHYAPDVLTDAVLSFKLLKAGGLLIFDDYLWVGEENVIYYPKIAIDAFTSIFSSHIKLIPAPINQIYAVKINEFIKK